jgi:hypothetical protein
MKSSTSLLRHLLSPAVLALALAGCASSEYMHEVPPGRAIAAAPDRATVVFVRPSGFGFAIKTTILDEHGGFVGESLPQSQFAVSLPPGKHLFIAWAENTGALQADLAPGKTYYVEVSPKMGALSARVHLLAIAPRTKSWEKLSEWLRESKAYDPDQTAGQAYLASRQGDVQERLRRANDAIASYDASELADRTLNPGDGR